MKIEKCKEIMKKQHKKRRLKNCPKTESVFKVPFLQFAGKTSIFLSNARFLNLAIFYFLSASFIAAKSSEYSVKAGIFG